MGISNRGIRLRSAPRRGTLLAFAIVLFASSLSCLAVYLRSRQALKDEVAEHILQAACAASVVVDGDHHPAFTSRDQEDSPEYTRAITSLAAFLSRTPGLQYVYTFVERDGELFMVLDPTPTGDRDRDGVDDKAHIMEPYSAGTEAMHRVLAEGRPTAESEPASDQWGTFMSAYAPVFDSSGTQVGAVGVDVAMGAYMQRLAGVRYALVLGLAIAVALSALVAMAVARLQATSARAQKTIDAMLEDLKTARDEASSAAKANAEFLAAMSHEIRNPMNAILGLSDVLIDADPPQGMRQDLELIRRSGTTLLAILNDVLDISKLEAGKFTLRPEPLDPRALMDDVVRLFTPLAREQSTRLDLRVDPAIPSRVLADPTRLCQIAGNLVSNALKFAKGGTVTLEVDRPPERHDWMRFRVTDTGVGIPEDEVDRVFDKFVQAGAGKEAGRRGSGLGLTIARSLVELMGGSIHVRSKVGEGSTFTFEIPLVSPDAAAGEDSTGDATRTAA